MCQVEVVFFCRNNKKAESLSFRYIASIIANWPGPECKLGHTQDTDIKRPSLLDGRTAPARVCQREEIAHLMFGTELWALCVQFSFSSFWDRKAESRTVPTLCRTNIPKYLYVVISNEPSVTALVLLTLRLLMSYIYMEHLFLMFLDHTQRRSTVGRTPLDE